MLRAIQIYEACETEDEARLIHEAQSQQEGYLGGRVLPPGAGKPGWKSQTFHDATGLSNDGWLPDGCRIVLVPNQLCLECSIPQVHNGAVLWRANH